jgi:hypothetical protein
MIVEVVFHSDVEEQTHMRVCNAVEDDPSGLPTPDQAGKSELAQLVAGSRFGGADNGCEVADTEFAGFQERVYHPESHRIGEELESGRQVLSVVVRNDTITHGSNPFGVEEMVFGRGVLVHVSRIYRTMY